MRLVALDPHTPLEQQLLQLGHSLDAILHKIPGDAVWQDHLAAYLACHPATLLLDPPEAISRLEDRSTMLSMIPMDAAEPAGTACSPQQRQQHPNDASGCGSSSGMAIQPPPLSGLTSDPAAWAACGMHLRAPMQLVLESRGQVHALAERGAAAEHRVGLPQQVGSSLKQQLHADSVSDAAALTPPLLLKTLRTDVGTASHSMAVVGSWPHLPAAAEQLQREATGGDGDSSGDNGQQCLPSGWVPLILQQYVPHDTQLYKVYVLGKHVVVERRASLTTDRIASLVTAQQQQCQPEVQHEMPQANQEALPDPPAQPSSTPGNVFMAQRVSALPVSAPGGDPACCSSFPAAAGSSATGALVAAVLQAAARALSAHLGLRMFNFDAVLPSCSSGSGPTASQPAAPLARLYVVDINYLPGYDKVSGWEAMMVDMIGEALGVVATGGGTTHGEAVRLARRWKPHTF